MTRRDREGGRGEEEIWRWTRWRRGKEEGGMESEEAKSRQGRGKIKNIKEESKTRVYHSKQDGERREKKKSDTKKWKVKKNWGLLWNRWDGNVVIVSNEKEKEIFLNSQKFCSQVTNKMLCCKAVTGAEEFPPHCKRNSDFLFCTCYKLVCVYGSFVDALDKFCSTDVSFLQLGKSGHTVSGLPQLLQKNQ